MIYSYCLTTGVKKKFNQFLINKPMKKLMFVSLCLVAFSCSTDFDSGFPTTPEAVQFVQTFYAAADSRGVAIDKNVNVQTRGTIVDGAIAHGEKFLYYPVQTSLTPAQNEGTVYDVLAALYGLNRPGRPATLTNEQREAMFDAIFGK